MKIKIKIIIFIILLCILAFFIFGLKPLINHLQVKYAKIEITLKEDLTLNFTEKKHVSDFIESINGKIVDDYIIDSTKIGEKSVHFEFVNDDGIKLPYEYKITIVDKVAPIIWLNSSYSITVGSNVDLTSKILCGDNEDGNLKRYIEGEYDYNTVGAYPLVYKAIDRSGNESEKEFTLYVNEKKASTSQNTPKTYTYFSDIVSEHKNENTKIGLDVSVWQEDIDFEAIKNAGVEFIIIRVGTTKGPDGEYMLDSKFVRNIEEANKYDIDVGIYFYSYANSIEKAKEEALWVIDHIKDYKVTLPIAFDWENWDTFNNYNISFFELTEMARTFLDTVKEAGYDGLLYSSMNFLENFWMLPINYDTWLAHYAKKTSYKGDYTYWQLCNNGKVDGIRGDVDIDIMYLDKAH